MPETAAGSVFLLSLVSCTSMMWFGPSAGIALTNMYPESRSVVQWLKHGWHVVLAYVLGFAVMMLTVGWHPHAQHKEGREESIHQP